MRAVNGADCSDADKQTASAIIHKKKVSPLMRLLTLPLRHYIIIKLYKTIVALISMIKACRVCEQQLPLQHAQFFPYSLWNRKTRNQAKSESQTHLLRIHAVNAEKGKKIWAKKENKHILLFWAKRSENFSPTENRVIRPVLCIAS